MSLIIVCASWAGESPGSWSGDYVPCDRHTELLKRGSMEIGVRFSTSNPDLAAQFARAMNFWASIIEMKWSRVENRDCAIQIVDGHAGLFKASQLARAQFPWTRSFQGWIAFNPKISSKPNELFVTAVHELGHLLGLPHNSNPASVMYFLRMEGPSFVDHTDVNLLAAQHKLRVLTVNAPVALPTRSTD